MTKLKFKSILTMLVMISGLMLISDTNLQAQNKTNNTIEKERVTKKSGMEMLEINTDKLPDEVKRDILKNFHDAEIIKAYKVWRPGAKQHEYWVDVKQGSKKWALQFDADGKAVHKVHPMP